MTQAPSVQNGPDWQIVGDKLVVLGRGYEDGSWRVPAAACRAFGIRDGLTFAIYIESARGGLHVLETATSGEEFTRKNERRQSLLRGKEPFYAVISRIHST